MSIFRNTFKNNIFFFLVLTFGFSVNANSAEGTTFKNLKPGFSFEGPFGKFDKESLKRGYEKMRTDFIANVSHELRTPLSSIIASVETIQNNANNDKTAQIKFLESMGKQAWRMSRLVEDLLTLSKIESDDLSLIHI